MNEGHEIISFLSPGSELLPWIFLILMSFLVIWTIGGVLVNARRGKWEKRWSGSGKKGAPLDTLDAEFGSVNDINDAVATRSEKLADIMPGILLVLGLLGTFLGLGMALNKASLILAHAGASSAGALNGDMSNLMGMMQGLGIKFKTSTWGIMGFLLLKLVFWWNDFEERRLRWSISKMKEEMDRSHNEERKRLTAHHDGLVQSVADVGNQFAEVMKTEFATDRSLTERLLLFQMHALTQAKISAEASSGTRELMEEYVKGGKQHLEKMSDSAEKIGTAADSLKETLDKFGTSVKETLGGVQSSLKSAIDDFSKGSMSSLQGIQDAATDMKAGLLEATKGIRSSLDSLSENVKEILGETKDSLHKAAETQKRVHEEFLNSSTTLQESVVSMKADAEKYGAEIRSGLKAISESNRETIHVARKLGDTQAVLEMLGEQMKGIPLGLGDVVAGNRKLQQTVEDACALASEAMAAKHSSLRISQ